MTPATPAVDAHVHVAFLGPDQEPSPPPPDAPVFMEPGPARGAVSPWMRRQLSFQIFLRYNRIPTDQVNDAYLRMKALEIFRGSTLDHLVCLALDPVYTHAGERRPDLSNMWVANEFVLELAAEYQAMLPPAERGRRRLLFGASVHPYARNFRERVRWCVDQGAVVLKWIPSAQQINLADPRVGDALEFLATARGGKPLPLLLHVGSELVIITTDPHTTSYDFISWSRWDRVWNALRPRAKRWAAPDLPGIHSELGRGLEAGASIIFAHLGLPYFAPHFLGRFAEHSDFDAVRQYLERYPGRGGVAGKCFADVSACVTPFRKSYFGRIARLPAGSVLAGSDFPVPVFELSADLEEHWVDFKAMMRGDLSRLVVPQGNLLDVNWRELQHAFPGHAMFTNFAQLM
jgi:hypothetical protein